MRTLDGGTGWRDVSPSSNLVEGRSLYDLAILSNPDEVLVVGDRCVHRQPPPCRDSSVLEGRKPFAREPALLHGRDHSLSAFHSMPLRQLLGLRHRRYTALSVLGLVGFGAQHGMSTFSVGAGTVWDDRGVILRTQDGGTSWTATTRTFGQLLATHFVNPTVGWVVGALDDTLLHTQDGGFSWRTQQLVGNPQLTVGLVLRAIAFSTASKGWVVGDRGACVVLAQRSMARC
jgi:photosystem II stability/assembly factor-like uncharacterized protein